MTYKKISEIKHVGCFNHITGDYSYEANGCAYLYIDGIRLKKDERAKHIVSLGEYSYVQYPNGHLEIYSGHSLRKVLKRDDHCEISTYFLNEAAGPYIGYSKLAPETLEWRNNILSLESEEWLLSQDVPYQLFKVGEMIFGYDSQESELYHLNHSGQIVWKHRLARVYDSFYSSPDRLYRILGVAGTKLWFCTFMDRLIAVDMETGNPVHQFSSPDSDRKNPDDIVIEYLGSYFFREVDKTIISISKRGVYILDAANAKCIENYQITKIYTNGVRSFIHGMVFLEEVNKLSFIANLFDTPHYGCAGILDLEEKQILWIDDLATSSSDTHIAPKQPAFESGDKLYVKDFNDTLHIYQRE